MIYCKKNNLKKTCIIFDFFLNIFLYFIIIFYELKIKI